MRCLGVFIIANNQGTPKAKTGKADAMIQYQPTPDPTHGSGQTLAERLLLLAFLTAGVGAVNRFFWTQAHRP